MLISTSLSTSRYLNRQINQHLHLCCMYYINQLSDNIKANKAKCFDPAMRFLELQTDFRPN